MTIPVNYSFTGKNDAIDITKPLLLSGIFEIFKQMIHSILGKNGGFQMVTFPCLLCAMDSGKGETLRLVSTNRRQFGIPPKKLIYQKFLFDLILPILIFQTLNFIFAGKK